MKTVFTSRRGQHTPSRMQSNYWVGMLVFIEVHRRIHGSQFGTVPKPLRDDAFCQGGYCLDAPELLPAGSTLFESFGPGVDDWAAVPTSVERTSP